MSTLINSTSLGNIIIVTGSFLLLLILVRLFAWNQIKAVFKEREEKISADIDGAEKARQDAEVLAQKRQEELSKAKDEASQIIDGAKATSQLQGEQIIAEAHQEAERRMDKASSDIAQEKQEALASLKAEVADLSISLAEKLVAKDLDEVQHRQLIDSYLDQLGDVK